MKAVKIFDDEVKRILHENKDMTDSDAKDMALENSAHTFHKSLFDQIVSYLKTKKSVLNSHQRTKNYVYDTFKYVEDEDNDASVCETFQRFCFSHSSDKDRDVVMRLDVETENLLEVLEKYKVEKVVATASGKNVCFSWKSLLYHFSRIYTFMKKRSVLRQNETLSFLDSFWDSKFDVFVGTTRRYAKSLRTSKRKTRKEIQVPTQVSDDNVYKMVIRPLVNLRNVVFPFCGKLLNQLKQDVGQTLTNGVNVTRERKKKRNVHIFSIKVPGEYTRVEFREGLATKKLERVVFIKNLLLDTDILLGNRNTILKKRKRNKDNVSKGILLSFRHPRRVVIPQGAQLELKFINLSFCANRSNPFGLVDNFDDYVVKTSMCFEFSSIPWNKKRNVNVPIERDVNSVFMNTSERCTRIRTEARRVFKCIETTNNWKGKIDSDLRNEEHILRRVRHMLSSKVRSKKSEILHDTIGIKRHLSKKEMTGNNVDAKLEDRNGRPLCKVFGSDTCPKDLQVIMLVSETQRADYRKHLMNGGLSGADLRIASDDTGERTAWTLYDLWNGVVWFWGDQFTQEYTRRVYIPMARMCSELSEYDDASRKRKLETDLHKIRCRHQRRQRALRKTVVNFVTRMYTRFIKPKFEIKNMTRKFRRLSREISARMLSIGHGKYIEELRRVSKERGVIIDESTDERHSSKCCGRCGHLHQNLGGSKMFICPNKECGNVEDRDGGAARKILLRWMYVQIEKHREMEDQMSVVDSSADDDDDDDDVMSVEGSAGAAAADDDDDDDDGDGDDDDDDDDGGDGASASRSPSKKRRKQETKNSHEDLRVGEWRSGAR